MADWHTASDAASLDYARFLNFSRVVPPSMLLLNSREEVQKVFEGWLMHLSYSGTVPAEWVRGQLASKTEAIFQKFHTLSDILSTSEEFIQTRWAGLNNNFRQAVLLEAWPDMPLRHRPDLSALQEAAGRPSFPSQVMNRRDCYLCPQINEEDFLKPERFLLLLSARGHNPPSDFACSDYMAMWLGLQTLRLTSLYLGGYYVTLDGVDGPEHYGKLIPSDELPDNFTRSSAYTPGEALLVLEAQQKILDFLLSCCESIMSGNCYCLNAPSRLHRPQPPLLPDRSIDFHSLLLVETAKAPYCLPHKTDFNRIETILRGALSAAEDHVWMLREDSRYFAQILQEIKDHQAEPGQSLPGEVNEYEPWLRLGSEDIISTGVARTMMYEMYFRLEYFAELHKQAQVLSQLHNKHVITPALNPSEELPEEFKHAITRFLFYAHKILCQFLGTFTYDVAHSALLHRFLVLEPIDTVSEVVRATRDAQYRTLSLLMTLCTSNNSTRFLRHMQPVEELAEVLEYWPEASELISYRVAKLLGDVAIVHYCIVQIYHHLPWARDFDRMLNEMDAMLSNELCQRKEWQVFGRSLAGLDLIPIVRQAELPSLYLEKDERFPRNKFDVGRRIERTGHNEGLLDKLWAIFDEATWSECGNLEGSPYHDVLSRSRVMRRTAAMWDPTGCDNYLYMPLSTIYVSKVAGGYSPLAPAVGTKGLEPASILLEETPLRVFQYILSQEDTGPHIHKITWPAFFCAMRDSRLFTIVNIYPFLWEFRRTSGPGGPIHFFIGRDNESMPFGMAKRYGRRLAREFGWTDRTFGLLQTP
ncbi:hypothetical protein F5Y14DRAFT_464996 [Nemania sp. NC0429]|nr:hypothetical protein F5Y14DRAFT_464996 [Nemania sp. NC0429]